MRALRILGAKLFERKQNAPLGKVDKIENGVIYGWVCSPTDMARRWLVDIFVDGVFAGQALSNLRREDLAAAGFGDGAYAFTLDVGHVDDTANVEAFALCNVRYALASSGPPGSAMRSDESWLSPLQYLQTTFAHPLRQQEHGQQTENTQENPAALFERLLEPASSDGPGKSLCCYYNLIRYRWGQSDLIGPILSNAQYEDFIEWYLSAYGQLRAKLRAPLRAIDIESLNRTAGSPLPTVAQRIFDKSFSASTAHDQLEKAFLWCAYEARSLWVEDCLIAPTHRKFLGDDTVDDSEEFPLTTFHQLFKSNNPMLASLPIATARDRSFLYFVVLLFSATAPHYLLFIPQKWRDLLFMRQSNGGSLFEEHGRQLFDADRVKSLEKEWREAIDSRKFDPKKNRFRTLTAKGARVYAAALPVPNARKVEVQLIGPFSRAHGVGQSCRRLAEALTLTDFRVRFCDFAHDHPNASTSSKSIELSPPGPAHINVIHLNLNELPGAFAYWPDVFSGAQNVAMPYLEIVPPAIAPLSSLVMIDEVWAASSFIASALAPFAKTVLLGSHCDEMHSIGREEARRIAYAGIARPNEFVFLTAGDALSGAFRKNPLGAAEAFLWAFPADPSVKLVIKTHSIDRSSLPAERAVWRALRQLSEEDPRIVLLDTLFDSQTHAALIEGADVFVSLHRAEGLGYHILEAMQLGTSVVATGYSGNIDFCNDRTALIVPYELTPVREGQYFGVEGGQVWAEPDIAAAAQLLRLAKDNQAQRASLVTSAKAFVEKNHSRQSCALSLTAQIRRLLEARAN